MRIGRDRSASLFQHADRLLSGHRRKIPQKNIKRVTGFEVLEKNPNWDTGACNDRSAAENFRV